MRRNELSNEIYHRIYRLAAKKLPINQIAQTLNLPFSVVKSIVDRFEHTNTSSSPTSKSSQSDEIVDTNYLDIYILQRLRYSILDLNGMIVEKNLPILEPEFERAIKSDSKVVALLMANVKDIDDKGWSSIMNFHSNFVSKGRYTALLDPSSVLEEYISTHKLDEKIDIFGTEKAFEDNAFKTKRAL